MQTNGDERSCQQETYQKGKDEAECQAQSQLKLSLASAAVSGFGDIFVGLVVCIVFIIPPQLSMLQSALISAAFAGVGTMISMRYDVKAITWCWTHRMCWRKLPKGDSPAWFQKSWDIVSDFVLGSTSWWCKGKPMRIEFLLGDVIASWLGTKLAAFFGLSKNRAKAFRKGLSTLNLVTAITHKVFARGAAGSWYNYSVTHNVVSTLALIVALYLGVEAVTRIWNRLLNGESPKNLG